MMRFECRGKPSKIWCAAFARGAFWWIQTWLQKCIWKACPLRPDFADLGTRVEMAAVVLDVQLMPCMLWIMQLIAVNWFRCRLHRSSWSLRRQTRAIASRMSSSSFKHNTTGAYPDRSYLKETAHQKKSYSSFNLIYTCSQKCSCMTLQSTVQCKRRYSEKCISGFVSIQLK